jgi:hypothetical protein
VAKDIRVRIVGDADGLKRSLKQSNASLDQFAKKADVAGKATHRLNVAAIAFTGGLVSGAGMVAGVKKAIDAASNLHEQLNKVDVVFATSAKSVKCGRPRRRRRSGSRPTRRSSSPACSGTC